MSAATTDPYKVLQVDREAGPEVIEAAYRRLAKMYHPDVASGRDADGQMTALNAAHDLLEDPVSRRAIDQDLARREANGRPRATGAHPSSTSATSTPSSTEDSATKPTDHQPPPVHGATSTAKPRTCCFVHWQTDRGYEQTLAESVIRHEAPKKDGQVQRVIAILAFLVFVITPLFDHGFPEPIVARFATGMGVWGLILFVQLVLDAPNWRTTPLGQMLRLTGRLLKRLVRASAWVAKTLGTRLIGLVRPTPTPEID